MDEALRNLLQNTSPGSLAVLALTGPVVKLLVGWFKRSLRLSGNAVQTAAAGVSCGVVGVYALAAGAVPASPREWTSLALVALLCWLGALGSHEALTDRSKPETLSGPAESEN